MGRDVTIAVQLVLLHGFNRECADMIGDHMKMMGVNFVKGVVPTRLERTEGGRIRATLSNGQEDKCDTVLGAIGRTGTCQVLACTMQGY